MRTFQSISELSFVHSLGMFGLGWTWEHEQSEQSATQESTSEPEVPAVFWACFFKSDLDLSRSAVNRPLQQTDGWRRWPVLHQEGQQDLGRLSRGLAEIGHLVSADWRGQMRVSVALWLRADRTALDFSKRVQVQTRSLGRI